MAKSKSAKRKRNAHANDLSQSVKISKTSTLPLELASNESRSLQTLVSDEELETTIDTLNLLSNYPNVIKSKACRDLRVAVYEFRKACTTGVNTADTNLTARITAALTDGRYMGARVLLAEMRIRKEVPKLGALCRWVRDLDVISGLSMHTRGPYRAGTERSEKEIELFLVLDAVMRVVGPIDTRFEASTPSQSPISLQEVWNLRETTTPHQLYTAVVDGSIFESAPPDLKGNFRVIENTPGPLRKPPNRHAAILYSSVDNALPLSSAKPTTSVHHHPIVPNLSMIKNVLSVEDCRSIVIAAQTIGFLPDAPVRDGGEEESSVLAHNFYWLVDEAFCSKLWDRVSSYVPDTVAGKRARGLNRRFRVYRYVPGAEYRCHIDGAWPPSGIDSKTQAYVYDSSPDYARQSSLFTFLIYLNDDFEAGETTFFMPSAREGIMNAYPVKPVIGAVVMFPHGETAGALLHEGTGVRKGAKYVIRTDVVYDVNANNGG